MTRRAQRELIFKLIFQLEFNGVEDFLEGLDAQLEGIQEELAADGRGNQGTEKYAEGDATVDADAASSDAEDGEVLNEDMQSVAEKARALTARLKDVDAMIAGHTNGWDISRIGKAELAILRLAVYEMEYDDDIPPKVAINEAVELTKIYCDEEAKGFVNAVLGNVSRDETATPVQEKKADKSEGVVTREGSNISWKK